jgi:UPF0716 protein FxsA
VPLALLILIFLAVPFAELYVIVQVVEPLVGVPLTIILLAADSVLGSILLRSQGRAVWRRFNEAMAAGRMPHREVIDGVLIIFGGAFLITPGFITDVVGLLLLIPPTRTVTRRLVLRVLGRGVLIGAAGTADRWRTGPRRSPAYDVEGTATEYEAPPRRLER